MIVRLFQLLPIVMLIIIMMNLIVRPQKTYAQWQALITALVSAIALTVDLYFNTIEGQQISTHARLIASALLCLFTPTMLVQAVKLIAAMQGLRRQIQWMNYFLLVPITLFTIQFALIYANDDNAIVLVKSNFFLYTMLLELMGSFGWIIYTRYVKMRNPRGQILRFYLHGDAVTPAYLMDITMLLIIPVFAFRSAIPGELLSTHAWISLIYNLLLTLLFATMGSIAIFSELPVLNIKVLLGPLQTNNAQTQRLMDEASENLPDPGKRWWPEVQEYIEEQRAYLDPELTLEQVANHLGTNQAYISRAINRENHQTFREYIAVLRVNYAKDYMKRHPEAKLLDVAMKSGFSDAAALAKQFKNIEGFTTREWLQYADNLDIT